MIKVNPYRPGAGLKPYYIAGREKDIEEAIQVFQALKLGIPVQSIIYTGLRGVGKTVLINQLQSEAEKLDIFCRHIEIEQRNDFIAQIASCSQFFIRKMNQKEQINSLINRAIDAIKSLVISFNPESNTFSLSLQEQELYKITSLTQSLTDVLVSVGEIAKESNCPVCFFIDEMQYMKGKELGPLISALHRCNQLGLPVMIIGAGLPKLYKMLAEEKSYTERLFSYQEIGSLTREETEKAICEPLKLLKVKYTDSALDKIFEITEGYPFFIQQLCKVVYDDVDSALITEKDVENGINKYLKMLDKGFFRSRFDKCSDMDKRFVFAMVKCGSLPCTIANIAKSLHKPVTSISTTRAQLISKGIIYAVIYSELDFTVPKFDEYILRTPEYDEWNNE